MELIQSEQNQWLKRCKALQQKKYRQQYGKFVAEGLRFMQNGSVHGAVGAVLGEEGRQEMVSQRS